MGFSHDATTHHFHLLKDEGEIIVVAHDPNDKKSIDEIRMHSSHIAGMFSSGNFNAPRGEYREPTKLLRPSGFISSRQRLEYRLNACGQLPILPVLLIFT